MTETMDTRDPFVDRLSDYLDDELDAAERAAADEHLAGCAECRAVLDDLRRVSLRARSLRDHAATEGLWPEIARRIGAPEAAGDGPGDELAARRRLRVPWLRMVAAAAAVLAVGIGIGRFTVPRTVSVPVDGTIASAPETAPTADPYRVAVARHLGRSEAMLTAFRAEAGGGAPDPRLAEWADDLLTQTRLLLDSPAADDPAMRALLLDLELVMVQIAQLPQPNDATETDTTETDLAERAIERSQVLPRMRTLVPAGSAPSTLGET